jgi:hypothetical protein
MHQRNVINDIMLEANFICKYVHSAIFSIRIPLVLSKTKNLTLNVGDITPQKFGFLVNLVV